MISSADEARKILAQGELNLPGYLLEAKGYLAGMKDPAVRKVVEAADKLISRILASRNHENCEQRAGDLVFEELELAIAAYKRSVEP